MQFCHKPKFLSASTELRANLLSMSVCNYFFKETQSEHDCAPSFRIMSATCITPKTSIVKSISVRRVYKSNTTKKKNLKYMMRLFNLIITRARYAKVEFQCVRDKLSNNNLCSVNGASLDRNFILSCGWNMGLCLNCYLLVAIKQWQFKFKIESQCAFKVSSLKDNGGFLCFADWIFLYVFKKVSVGLTSIKDGSN